VCTVYANTIVFLTRFHHSLTLLYYILSIVDEAGRGPLAGPVVAAAAIIPTNIPGITDSKKLTKEEDREVLYEKIVSSPNARWAIAISDAKRIDEINILQATLEAMKAAVQATIKLPLRTDLGGTRQVKASSKIEGCYVVCGSNDSTGKPENLDISKPKSLRGNGCHALIDGNRLPKDMPCDCEAIVKGDSREYSIGAASILAKVTRDRLMHEYDLLYPEYDLAQHKGYPTALHMAKVKEFGASKIHRRTFAPLKHMKLDKNGKILPDE
jgi:ribonuclease HII